jgi:hypothetical protein
MFVGTHASLPVILATAVNAVYSRRKGRVLFRVRHLAAIAVGGVLPDIVWPHLSLHARLTSWSHTAWFLSGLAVVLLAFGRRLLDPGWKPAAAAVWLAVALHLGVDTISGGTVPLYPFGHQIGFRTISFHSWIFVDLVTLPLAVLGFVWTHRKTRPGRRANEPRSEPAETANTQGMSLPRPRPTEE